MSVHRDTIKNILDSISVSLLRKLKTWVNSCRWLIREEEHEISPKISPPKINEPDLNSRLNEDDEASAQDVGGEILLVISCSF